MIITLMIITQLMIMNYNHVANSEILYILIHFGIELGYVLVNEITELPSPAPNSHKVVPGHQNLGEV